MDQGFCLFISPSSIHIISSKVTDRIQIRSYIFSAKTCINRLRLQEKTRECDRDKLYTLHLRSSWSVSNLSLRYLLQPRYERKQRENKERQKFIVIPAAS